MEKVREWHVIFSSYPGGEKCFASAADWIYTSRGFPGLPPQPIPGIMQRPWALLLQMWQLISREEDKNGGEKDKSWIRKDSSEII